MRRITPLLAVALLSVFGSAFAQNSDPKTAPKTPQPPTRTALLATLSADPDVRKALAEQIAGAGGKADDVLAGKAAAIPTEDVKDIWHQGALLTPRDSQIKKEDKVQGQLVVYNVFMHSLQDCLSGNFLPVATGTGTSPFAAAGLYDLPGAENHAHPWIVEVGFELAGLKEGQVRLQFNHEAVPAIQLGETELVGFVRVGGGRHFVEITQPPADPQHRTRRFWYTRVMRL